MAPPSSSPIHDSYDIIIVGGAIMGSAAAFFLADSAEFDGRILVIERDPSYSACSTAHTNSCIRQQFSDALNVTISQFTAAFIANLPDRLDDSDLPRMKVRNFGYLYLAGDAQSVAVLRNNHAVQCAAGAGTRLLSPDELAQRFPFFDLDGIRLGSHNTRDEGYFDGSGLFDAFRRTARKRGVDYLCGEVADISTVNSRVTGVSLTNGTRIACGTLINATGPRAALTARMAGLSLPVEPRKRYTYVFRAERPLDRPLPLTIDPSGYHVRENGGGTYMAGARPLLDQAVAPDDFEMDHSLWEQEVWPAIAARIPQFDAVKVLSEWAGHYAFNTFDQNAIIGPDPEIANFIHMSGFSGHGLQQSPAMGRGVAEWITLGRYDSLDLSPFAIDRIRAGQALRELAVI